MACILCGNEFKEWRKSQKYCSHQCYINMRWKGNGKCKWCSKATDLIYCSLKCQQHYWDENNYDFKKAKIWERKKAILLNLGGKCKLCGITDIRVLDIDHIDREKKKMDRKHYVWHYRLKEWEANMQNLQILCSNCHRIKTWQQMGYGLEEKYCKVGEERLRQGNLF